MGRSRQKGVQSVHKTAKSAMIVRIEFDGILSSVCWE